MVATHSTPSRFTSVNHLHTRFRRYGAQALVCRNKCIGMLPRIFKEKIYEQQGFDSIFEYAAKFAGLSREQVTRALGLHAHFADKPVLAAALETGEVSMNKLARIASIATRENQEFLADQAKLLSKTALETLAKDMKRATMKDADAKNFKNTNGLFEPKTYENPVPGHGIFSPLDSSKLELSDEVQEKLLSLKNKGLDINAILLELLEKREREIEQEKEQITLAQATQKTQSSEKGIDKPLSRHIPAKTRRILQKEHGEHCSIENCNRPSQHIHHTRRFALDGSHNPHYLAPLCREHHQIAHSIDIRFQEVRKYKIQT